MSLISDIKRICFTGAAVYISDDFIDIARAQLSFGGVKAAFLQRYPILKNIAKTSYAEAGDEIGRIFDKAFSETATPYRIAVNLRNDSFILRQFTLRGVPENELKNAVVFEAQKYVPYTIEDLIYGFRICARKGDSQKVIFVGTEQKNVHGITAYFETKNILPSIIEVTPTLIARAIALDPSVKKDGAYISLHYEPNNKAVITGICHRHPHFFKEIRIFPGDEEFKTAELCYRPLKDVWAIIENDVVGSVEYMRREAKKDVERIFISGFTPSSEDNKISKDFGIPFARLNPSFFKESRIENPDRYLPALSLLYDCLHKPSLNLAAEDVIHKDLCSFKPVIIRSAALALVIVALHVVLVAVNYSTSQKLVKLEKASGRYGIMTAESSKGDIDRYYNTMKEKAAFINGVVAARPELAPKLKQLGSDMPEDSWVNSLVYRSALGANAKTTLAITGGIYPLQGAGVASANTIVQQIKEDAVMMQGFSEVELSSIGKSKVAGDNASEFEIILK